MKSLNIVFAGTPEFGLPCLNALLASHHSITAIYSQPDRPAGRGQKLQISAVKEWAVQKNIPIYQPLNFKSPEALEQLAALQPDVLIVIAYGLILPRAVLEIPRLGCINVHASLLPRWRGASPIQQAILHGDEQSGVTIMQMDVGMDTGNMLAKIACPLDPQETAGSLHDKLAQIAAEPLLRTLDLVAEQQAQAEIQNNDLATYAAKINKEDAHIKWQQSAKEIDQVIRAFNPWPIAYTAVNNEFMRIYQARILDSKSESQPGTVLKIEKSGLSVATASNDLLIEKIQFPGGKAMAVADWLNASKAQLYVGLILQ